MFRSKTIVTTIIFLILLIVTSVIKNQKRIIEKKIIFLNKKVVLKERDLNETQLDFYFLTSPAQIEKKVKILGLNNYSAIAKSKIFSSFSNMQRKLLILVNKNENKNQKN